MFTLYTFIENGLSFIYRAKLHCIKVHLFVSTFRAFLFFFKKEFFIFVFCVLCERDEREEKDFFLREREREGRC